MTEVLEEMGALLARLEKNADDEARVRRSADAADAAKRAAATDARFGAWTARDGGEDLAAHELWSPPELRDDDLEPEPLLVVTSRRQGGVHVVVTGSFSVGRIRRERGEALCSEARRFGHLRRPTGRTFDDLTCVRCRDLVARHKLSDELLRAPRKAPERAS